MRCQASNAQANDSHAKKLEPRGRKQWLIRRLQVEWLLPAPAKQPVVDVLTATDNRVRDVVSWRDDGQRGQWSPDTSSNPFTL